MAHIRNMIIRFQKTLHPQVGFLFFIIFMNFAIIAHSKELHFKQITVNDGLTQHDVSCILQDSYGFMWIGTYDGLNRYDGFKILNFYHITDDIESLSSNRIKCLFEDSKKRIWIGTDGSGLNYYSLITEKFVRIKIPETYNRINGIAENKKGEIFIATSNGVLKINENEEDIFAELMQLPITGTMVYSVAVSDQGMPFFATNVGIWYLDDERCAQIEQTKNQNYTKLFFDKNSNLWAAGSGKLSVFKPGLNTFSYKSVEGFSAYNIKDICQSINGDIWVGTMSNGIFKILPDNYPVIQNTQYEPQSERGLLSNSVLTIYCDQANSLWVGNRNGLCYTNLNSKNFRSISFAGFPNIPNKPHIRALFVDGDNVYFSIQNRGCFLYSQSTGEVQKLFNETTPNILTIEKLNGKIYAGSSEGIFYMDENKRKFEYDPLTTRNGQYTLQPISSMCEDKFGNQYFGSFAGLIIRNRKSTDWIHYLHPQTEVLRGKRIFSILYDSLENCIWMGTISEGLFKLNLTDDGNYLSLETYNKNMPNSYHIANNSIWCFYKSRNGTLWIGTDAGLLSKPVDSDIFTQIKTPGIVDKKIMGIVEDKAGHLWLSNSQGLIRYSPEINKSRRYTYNDGLLTNTFTEAVGKSENNILFFGGIHGINYFNPDEINNSPFQSEVAISDFRVHNISISPGKEYFGRKVLKQSINKTEELTLNYKQNNFLFEFTGTNYANSNENSFRYKLEGYNPDWIYTSGSHRFAPYSNLKQGSYIFRIEAANHDGIWSKTQKVITIKILPPPWFSVWAYIIYFIVVCSIILSFIYFLNNRQKLKHQIELEHLKHTKDQEINELKLMFFTDVAHEFKTPLSLIIGPLNDLIQNKLSIDQRDFCFKIVSRNTKRMMFLVNQLLDFRKISANKNILRVTENDLAEFIEQTSKAFMWQAKSEEINFNIITPESFQCYFDRDIIEKVVYNLLSNALKYTPKKGIVEIEVKPLWKEGKQFANIIIRDSGKGIPNDQKDKVFERYFHGKDRSSSGIGLHLSYTLIKAHKGETHIADSAYGGTEFIVSVPVSKLEYKDFELFEQQNSNALSEQLIDEMDVQSKETADDRETVLIVEDDHDLRVYLTNCLNSTYTVCEASNGMEGLKIASEILPEIIVSDVMMPEMDGIEMCKRLKNNKETSHIPVLMLTAKTAQEQQNEGLEAGAWDYITKPFNTQALLKKISNIIQARNSFRETMLHQNVNIEIKKRYTPFDQKLIAKATKIIEENMSNDNFTVEDFAATIGLSRMQLHRKLKSLVGYSTTEFINTIKIKYATKLFDQGCDRISEAMDAVGINSYSHFNNLFKKINGKSAKDYISLI